MTRNLTQIIKDNSGEVPFYVFPGGYQISYLMADGGIICHKCAKDNRDLILESELEGWDKQWIVADLFIHEEGESIICDNCNCEIESEYGIPD